MIDCALMGLDWRDLTWWEYTAALATWNARHSDGKAPSAITLDKDKMRAAMAMVH